MTARLVRSALRRRWPPRYTSAPEFAQVNLRSVSAVVRRSSFDIRHSFVIRASTFVIAPAMQSYDFLMLAVVIGCMVFGAWKGMAWQVASLASIIVSYFGSVNFAGVISPMIKAEPPWNNALAMLIVYVVSSIGVWMVFRLVSGFIDSVRLRDFDRQVGAAFGAGKGVLLCLVITFFAVSLSPQTAGGMVRSSRAGYYMTQLLKESDPYLPTRVREVLGPYINQLENQLNQPGGVPNGPNGPFPNGPSPNGTVPNGPGGFPPFPGNPLQPQRPGVPGQPQQ